MTWRALQTNKASFKNWIVNEGTANEQILRMFYQISGKWRVELIKRLPDGKGKKLFSKPFITKPFAIAYTKSWMRQHPHG